MLKQAALSIVRPDGIHLYYGPNGDYYETSTWIDRMVDIYGDYILNAFHTDVSTFRGWMNGK